MSPLLDFNAKGSEKVEQGADAPRSPRNFAIPVCYEMQLDLERVAEHTALSQQQVIERHTGEEYTVYAIGSTPMEGEVLTIDPIAGKITSRVSPPICPARTMRRR